MFSIAETAASDANKHVLGFSGLQKFEKNFQPSDKPCMTTSATALPDMQSVTDESVDRSQSEFDQLQSECTSEAEESDVAAEKLSRRKVTKPKNDSVVTAVTSREW